MARISNWDMQVRIMRFLSYVGEREREDARALAVRKDIMAELGLSADQFRLVRRRVVGEGLVLVEARFLASGGQLASTYRLTERGRRVLARLRAACFDEACQRA